MLIQEIPYAADSTALAESLLHLPYFIFLDSNYPHDPKARFDIIAANPSVILHTENNRTIIREKNTTRIANTDIFSIQKEYLARHCEMRSVEAIQNDSLFTDALPFTTGWIGYWGYDIGRSIEHLENKIISDITLPDAYLGFYEASIIVDHLEKKSFEIRTKNTPSLFQQRKKNNLAAFELTNSWKPNITREQYAFHFSQIKKHLEKGDVYQVNYAQRFSAPFTGHPWHAYLRLRKTAPNVCSAFIHHPKGSVLSVSPEHFIQVEKNVARTYPIKGTRPRLADAAADQKMQTDLLNSAKDVAENVMIVDLLRNDFGRCCVPGSVQVTALCALQTFSNVHHFVSEIAGILREDQHALDLLRACFPGGSVTGAPKISAMKMIENVEAQRRSVYCGSIGYCDVRGNLDTNIAIRTMIANESRMHCYGGGAIVVDSECDAEYEESVLKIKTLMDALL